MEHQTHRQTYGIWGPALAALLLVGCSSPLPPQETLVPPRLEFDLVSDRVAFDGTTPDWVAVDALLARNGAQYGDQLVLSGDSEILLEAARRYAPLGIRVAAGLSADGGQAVFLRTLVIPPECGRWVEGADADGDNQVSPNFGCADLSNLARMVADPNDLIAGSSGAASYNPVTDARGVARMRSGTLEIETINSGAVTTGD